MPVAGAESVACAFSDFARVGNYEEVLGRLIPTARSVMLGHRLAYGPQNWAITALELYLWNGNGWCDPNTDRKPGQSNGGTWYINKSRSPNYGRIDVAVGNSAGVFAGLLIRELDYQDGSAKALQTIIRGRFKGRNNNDRWTADDLSKIQEISGAEIFSGPLKLVPVDPTPSDLWIGRRISSTRNAVKRDFIDRYPLRVAVWQTERLKGSMKLCNQERNTDFGK